MKYNKTEATPKTNMEVARESLREQEYLNEQQKALMDKRLGVEDNKVRFNLSAAFKVLKKLIG